MIFDKIKEVCEERNISIYKLEKDCGFSVSTICKWNTSSPTVENLKKVADYFDLTVDYFL